MQKIDLTPLIKALEAMNQAKTYEAQLAELELILIEAELNPCPADFYNVNQALVLLAQVTSREVLPWSDDRDELEPFFTAA
jgi:hypothetical protein